MYMSQQVTYPMSKEECGKSYWDVMLNSASQFSENPSEDEKNSIKSYLESTIDRFTCEDCVENAHTYMNSNPMILDNRKALVKWICGIRNNANRHANKPEIDCDTFVSNSLKEDSCKSCSVVRKTPVPTVVPKTPPMPVLDKSYLSIWDFDKRYPSFGGSMKKAVIAGGTGVATAAAVVPQQPQQIVTPTPAAPTVNELSTRYPSLSQYGMELGDDELAEGAAREELHGLLRNFDNFYNLPSQWVGISPSQMNLAFSPELISNGFSMVTQMYLTNAGSMLTSLLSSVTLIVVSAFGKNSIANYDRLLIQNVAGSLLFHTMNFFNPRIKDAIVPDLKKLGEGIMSFDGTKVKEALLFGEKDTQDVGSKHLIEILNAKNGAIDMKKLPRDLRGLSGNGLGGGGGSLTSDELEHMLKDGGPTGSGTPTNYDSYGDAKKKYEYILDNEFM